MQKLNGGNLFTEKGTVNIQTNKQNKTKKRKIKKYYVFSNVDILSPPPTPLPFSKKKGIKRKSISL